MENELDKIKNVAHYISVTGIIVKNGRFLICQRSPNERIFPGKWCVPGGKMEQRDIIAGDKGTHDHWLDVLENTLRKEIREETGLEIQNIGYVSSLALMRPNGFTTIIISMHADHHLGEVRLDKNELVDHAWVTLDEAKDYDLIDNIYEQLEVVAKR